MKTYEVNVSRRFTEKLSEILNFINKDSPQTALDYERNIIRELSTLDRMPFRCRQSIYFDVTNIRDLILKGFTIVFEVKDNQVGVFVKFKLKP